MAAAREEQDGRSRKRRRKKEIILLSLSLSRFPRPKKLAWQGDIRKRKRGKVDDRMEGGEGFLPPKSLGRN